MPPPGYRILLGVFLLASPAFCCETGVAHVSSLLSVPRSLMANADVALLHTYSALTLARCMEECCTRTYGACSVASFKKNSTTDNCMHFYCRPLNKCKFLYSNSTDTFTFSSEPPVPSSSSTTAATREQIATFSEEQFALKNDNTTVKPRKGVDDDGPLEDLHPHTSGVKPRKGVSKGDIPHSELIPSSLSKSNVKPRKGVEDLSTVVSYSSAAAADTRTEQPSASPVEDIELMSALERVFEDDAHSAESSLSVPVATTSVEMSLVSHSTDDFSTSHTRLFPSVATPSLASSSLATKTLQLQSFTRQFVSAAVEEQVVPRPSSSSIVVMTTIEPSVLGSYHEKLIAKENDIVSKKVIMEDEETETDRRYKSSIHLVLSLVFGLLVLFAVLGVVAKRVYDGWLRRDYFRMNYLIDGIYNGVD